MDEIERVRRYLAMRDEKPLRQMDDVINAIHTGTDWEAELRLSDLRRLLAEYDALEANTIPIIEL